MKTELAENSVCLVETPAKPTTAPINKTFNTEQMVFEMNSDPQLRVMLPYTASPAARRIWLQPQWKGR